MTSTSAPAPRDRDDRGRPEQTRPRDRTGRPLPYDTDEVQLAEVVEPATVEEALAVAVDRWGDARFFEAHELLEFVWHWSLEDDEKAFWQGVIQVAAAMVHDQRGNPWGVVRTIDKALPKLLGMPDDHHGIDVAGLRAWCRSTADLLRRDREATIRHVGLSGDPSGIHLAPGRRDTPIERRGRSHAGTLGDASDPT